LKHAVCVGGEHAAPPEDVGGISGFGRFLEALADPTDEERESYIEWSGGNYDFSRCDLAEINARLQQTP
ncbi:MAG: plasmid pRiA4b ORF-3 family protein, partial [Acidimicrobiales bacterium]